MEQLVKNVAEVIVFEDMGARKANVFKRDAYSNEGYRYFATLEEFVAAVADETYRLLGFI